MVYLRVCTKVRAAAAAAAESAWVSLIIVRVVVRAGGVRVTRTPCIPRESPVRGHLYRDAAGILLGRRTNNA